MANKTHHVIPAPNGGWNVKKGGAEKLQKHFDKKEDAISYARRVSKNQDSELVIHKKMGEYKMPIAMVMTQCHRKIKIMSDLKICFYKLPI